MWSHQEMNSIFYVDSDYESLSFNNSKMETEVRTLKQELSRTRDALKLATKRCRDLVRELDSRTVGHETERCLRDQQLSRILRALLVLESRLKQEQKSIRQLLCEKDNVIRNQQLEIAKLRRYTKNYIKCKREQNRNSSQQRESVVELSSFPSSNFNDEESRKNANEDETDVISNELGNEIRRLKHEIIDKLSTKSLDENEDENSSREIHGDNRQDEHRKGSTCCIRKTNSFAGSDVSKESCTSSSENTDAVSILTTTTDESSPSLLSTEGFCEGESTDCSPASTLDKSSSKTFVNGAKRINVESDTRDVKTTKSNVTIPMTIEDIYDKSNVARDDDNSRETCGLNSDETLKCFFNDKRDTKVTITRTESKDDGMDCNYASDDENFEDIHEPIYANACNDNNARNLRESMNKIDGIKREKNEKQHHLENNNRSSKLEQEETSMEETSGNWYSDPDEDKISDDVFRHTTYRPNGNHNSVLECVNQILLRDMEEEENVMTAPARRFKHRGRIVRFQPARLSDIESVGSEMERRNSDDCTNDRDVTNDSEMGNFEATASEDEFGMKIERNCEEKPIITSVESKPNGADEKSDAAIPIVVIEPKTTADDDRIEKSSCLEMINQSRSRSINRSASPTSRMERIEEKTCLQMSTRGLTIAKNLDYEDIESLPEVTLPTPKTPPALPPKPTQFRNTLVLKKIPSPSFLIDETRRKNPRRSKLDMEKHGGNVSSCLVTPSKIITSAKHHASARSLVFEDKYPIPNNRTNEPNSNDSPEKNRSTSVKSSSHQSTKDSSSRTSPNVDNLTPRVTNIVRHFEEFKIGGDNDRTISRDHERSKDERGRGNVDFDNFDIRQNFEEFNLDDCDLSDDPNRPEADGSERLGNIGVRHAVNDKSNAENNNLIFTSNCAANSANNTANGFYDNFLEATGLSNKSILTPSRLLSNHKSMLKPKDVKYKNKIKSNAVMEKNHLQNGSGNFTQVRHWTGPFV